MSDIWGDGPLESGNGRGVFGGYVYETYRRLNSCSQNCLDRVPGSLASMLGNMRVLTILLRHFYGKPIAEANVIRWREAFHSLDVNPAETAEAAELERLFEMVMTDAAPLSTIFSYPKLSNAPVNSGSALEEYANVVKLVITQASSIAPIYAEEYKMPENTLGGLIFAAKVLLEAEPNARDLVTKATLKEWSTAFTDWYAKVKNRIPAKYREGTYSRMMELVSELESLLVT